MKNKLPKVLIISSLNPYIGPGIVGLQNYNALKQGGFEVDLLTKYPVKENPEFISVFKNRPGKFKSFIDKVKKKIKREYLKDVVINAAPEYGFFYKKETTPEVPIGTVLKKINKRYDIVYILFWQELMSFATVNALYDKLKCQFQFRCVDYSTMAGGCHFTIDCQRYKKGCGLCPVIKSHKENDFTRWNVKYRQKLYEKVRPIVIMNSYMKSSFYDKSYLLKDYDRIEVAYPLIDNNVFKPFDMESCREKYNIPKEKNFLLFLGSQLLDNKRKGFGYLLDALLDFHERLTAAERKRVLLIIAGRNIEEIKEHLCFDYYYLGYVSMSRLPYIYSMSNVFLSSSVDDAGPLMVNQSISCGTPVVAFEMGTALDVIKGQGTGYCAEFCNAKDFANGIEYFFRMNSIDYKSMRDKCRDFALSNTSEKAFIDRFLMIYEKYK